MILPPVACPTMGLGSRFCRYLRDSPCLSLFLDRMGQSKALEMALASLNPKMCSNGRFCIWNGGFFKAFRKTCFHRLLALEMALAILNQKMCSNGGFCLWNGGFFEAFRKTCFHMLSGILWLGAHLYVNLRGILWFGAHQYVNFVAIYVILPLFR